MRDNILKFMIWLLAGASILAAQATTPPGAQRGPRMPQPSTLMTAPAPEQDITITIHISSDLATAIEKHRRDTYKAVVNDANGSVSLQPVNATIQDQVIAALVQGYFSQVMRQYPSASIKKAQDAAAAAQKAASDAAAAGAAVQKK